MLTAYAVFTIGMVLASSLVLAGYSRSFLREEIESSNRHLLSQVQILIDRTVVQEIYGIINRIFLNSVTSSEISDFFMQHRHQPDFFLYLKNAISYIAINSEFIDSIYLYRLDDDTLVESEGGVTFFISDRRGLSPGLINADILEMVRMGEIRQAWISPAENTGFPASRPAISYIRGIPLYGDDPRRGYIIFNVDESVVVRGVQEIYNVRSSEILAVDASGHILFHTDRSSLFESVPAAVLSRLHGNSGFSVLTIRQRQIGVSWVHSAITDWYYLSLTPLDTLNRRLVTLRKMTSIIMTIAIAFSIIIMVPLTIRLYRPFRNLVFMVRNRLNSTYDGKTDLEFISSTITGLMTRVDEMEQALEENRSLIEHKMMNDILTGNVMEREALLRRIRYLGLDTNPPLFTVLLLEIDRSKFTELHYGPREYLTIRLNTLIGEFFGNRAISVTYAPGRFGAILEAGSMVHASDMDSLLHLVEDRTGMRSNIAWNPEYCQSEGLADVWSRLRLIEYYAYTLGYGNAFPLAVLEQMERCPIELSLRESARIEALLRSGRLDEFFKFLTEFNIQVVKERYSHTSVALCVAQLHSLVLRVFRDLEIGAEPSIPPEIRIDDSETLGEALSMLRKLCEILDADRSGRIRHIDGNFLDKIRTHISETIGRQTSLVTVSEVFGISPGHLSRIFKEGTGTSFSEFVASERLNRAALLLESDVRSTVTEIAHAVGYDNQSYFSRLFRQRFGMTPGVYRKNKLSV